MAFGRGLNGLYRGGFANAEACATIGLPLCGGMRLSSWQRHDGRRVKDRCAGEGPDTTTPHLVGALFKLETETDFSFIPYKGGAPAVADMLGGHIQMNIGTSSTLRPLIRDGRLRALAVTGTTRMAELPEVPTMIESGYPNVTSAITYGILGPAGLSADVVKRLNASVNECLKSPELTASMAKLGFEPKGGAPQDFATLIAHEMQKWIPIVKATGFQMEYSYRQSPSTATTSASAATAAVSARRMRGPSARRTTFGKRKSATRSSSAKPPSGPTSTASGGRRGSRAGGRR